MAKGRKTGGKRKGYKAPKTLAKEAAREYVRQRVTAELGELLDVQLKHAKGLSYLVARRKSGGKFERIEATRVAQLDPEEYVIEVWEKDPSVQAFTDLLNRALDKPVEHHEHAVELTDLHARLQRGRARNAQP